MTEEVIYCPNPGCGGKLTYSQHSKTVRALEDELELAPPEILLRCKHEDCLYFHELPEEGAAYCPQCHERLRKTEHLPLSDANTVEALRGQGITFWKCRNANNHPAGVTEIVAMLPSAAGDDCPQCGTQLHEVPSVVEWRRENAPEYIGDDEELPAVPTILVCENYHFFIPYNAAPVCPACGSSMRERNKIRISGRTLESPEMRLLVCVDRHYYTPERVCLKCGRPGVEELAIRKVRAIEDVEAEARRRKGFYLCPKCKSMFPAKMIADKLDAGELTAPVDAPTTRTAQPCKCVEKWEAQLNAAGKSVKMPLSKDKDGGVVRCAKCDKDYEVKWEVVKRDDDGAWEVKLTIAPR